MAICERCWTKILVIALYASSAWSQEEQQSPPPSPDTLKADTRPLSGAESITLGSLVGERSYLQPGFAVSESVDTNAQLQFGGHPGVISATTLAGRLTLEHIGKRNHFSGGYQGGGIIYETNSDLNSTFHLGAISDSISFRRATLTLSDRGGFLPGSYAGIGGYGGAFNFGNLPNVPGLNASFLPARSIVTNAGGYMNAALAQLEYNPGARSSVTVAGAFQTLSSSQPGFVSSNAAMLQTGYNRSLTARDAVAVFYSTAAFHYTGIAQNNDVQFIAFSYGRRVTGRVALQLFGGPEFYTVAIPGHSETHTFASGGADLTYRWPETQAHISYWRGFTAGSGVLTGSETDSVSAGLSRRVLRAWAGTLSGSYSFNSGVSTPTSTTVTSGTARHQYGYWTCTANLTRSLGRLARLGLFYSLQTQKSNAAFSSGNSIGHSISRNIFGVTFSFDYRPVGI